MADPEIPHTYDQRCGCSACGNTFRTEPIFGSLLSREELLPDEERGSGEVRISVSFGSFNCPSCRCKGCGCCKPDDCGCREEPDYGF